MPYVETNGQRIHYTDNKGDGPPVLFSHGFLMDHEMWAPQADALAGRFRCVTWDERGFGQTESSDEPFDMWDLAADAVALLDHLEIDDAVWCGMSQGGFLSLRAALSHPARVRALALIDTSPRAENPDVKGLYEAMFDQALGEGFDENLADAVAGVLFGPSFDASAWRAKWTAKPPATLRHAFGALVGRDDISSRLGEIVCPVVVLHGEDDAPFAVDEAQGWATKLPGLTEFVRVPGAGHTSNLENPEVVNEALLRFLARFTGETA